MEAQSISSFRVQVPSACEKRNLCYLGGCLSWSEIYAKLRWFVDFWYFVRLLSTRSPSLYTLLMVGRAPFIRLVAVLFIFGYNTPKRIQAISGFFFSNALMCKEFLVCASQLDVWLSSGWLPQNYVLWFKHSRWLLCHRFVWNAIIRLLGTICTHNTSYFLLFWGEFFLVFFFFSSIET